MSVFTEIENCKKQLVQEAKQKGISENFGLKQVIKLENKYGQLGLTREFAEWCMNFDLAQIE